MSGIVQMRLSGELGDVIKVLAKLLGSNDFRLQVGESEFPNRRGGVRVYLDLADPAEQQRPS